MPYLIQMLLPLNDNSGRPFPKEKFTQVKDHLMEKFGGVTLYSRAPAEGLWNDGDGEINHDSMVILEVMADELKIIWWKKYRRLLEDIFQQDEVILRASEYVAL